MTLWAFVVILAALAYRQRTPKRVIRYQPREVPIARRRPSPFTQIVKTTIEAPNISRTAQTSIRAPFVPHKAAGAVPARSCVTVVKAVNPDLVAALRQLGFSARAARQEIDTGSSLARAIARSLAHG